MYTPMGMDRLADQVDKERRDLTIFATIIADGPIGIVRLAEKTGVPEHKVRYSLRMLENDGLIEPTPEGAAPADDVDERVSAINEGIDDLIDRIGQLKAIFAEDAVTDT